MGVAFFQGTPVRPMAPVICWFLCGSLLHVGCVGGPAPGRNAGSSPAAHRDVDSVETQNNDGTTSFAHHVRRTFPEQGWWCSEFEEWLSPERVDKGYTIVLPGIEGTSCHNISIARGLIDAGYPAAIEVRDWTTGHWPLWPYHLMALQRNKRQAQEIAAQIVEYQNRHPGRPVNLIGHSGGAAMAVLALEALPDDHPVTQVVLLAAALSPKYDLTTALTHTEKGIDNFHSWGDMGYLVVGTFALGTIDRKHTISAGASGFQIPDNLNELGRERYIHGLHQVSYRLSMLRSLNFGGHFSPANRKFVAEWVASRLDEMPRRE